MFQLPCENNNCTYVNTNYLHPARFEVLTAVVMKCPIFCEIASCSPLKFNRRFGGTRRLHLGSPNYLLNAGSCLAYYSTLKTEVTYSSETSVDFQRSKLRHIPEDMYLHIVQMKPVQELFCAID
jgi:hypothetical protein